MSFTIVEPAEVIYEAITHAFSIECKSSAKSGPIEVIS
jgi:hypothetical protein